MASAASGLRHPASASCLGRHARLTGRCPNNSSLFPPLAAVVVVASHLQRKNYLYFRHTGASADAPVCHFHGWGRKGDRHLQRLLPAEVRREPSQSSLHDASSLGEGANPLRLTPFARFPLLSLHDIFPRPGEVFPLGGSWQSRQALTERARTVVLRPCFSLYMYKSDRTAHTKHCVAGAAEFSTGRKACGLCILHRKCAF